MDPISRTVTIFTLVIVIRLTVGNIRVDKCPTEEGSWIARASSVICDKTKGMSYHCIKDYKNELLEVCVRKIKIPPGTGGCPWVFVEPDGTAIFGAIPTFCRDRNFCPDKNHTGYYTDQLYKYPGCIQSDYTTRSTTTKTTSAITTMTIGQNTIASETIVEEVPYFILCVLMPFLFICIEIWNIKKQKYAVSSKYKSESTPQNQTSQQRTPEDGRSDMTEQKGNEYVPFPSSQDQNVNNDKKDGVKPGDGESDASSAENGGNSPENRVHFWVTEHGFLFLHLLVRSTLFVMFYAADISFYGKLFSIYMAILLIIIVFLGCVAFVFILFKLDRDRFHEMYRKFIFQLFQLLALNCVLKYLVQTIFFAVQDESNDYIASIILFVCMVLFLSLHYFFHCKTYEIF